MQFCLEIGIPATHHRARTKFLLIPRLRIRTHCSFLVCPSLPFRKQICFGALLWNVHEADAA